MLDVPELQYVAYRNGRLAYRAAGAGRTLFLLHGMNGSSESWAYLFRSLSQTFRVVAWDAPSFGASDVFGDTTDDFKRAAKALMNTLQIENAVLVGHSMGGVVAVQLAADQQASIAGLVLSSTHLGFARPKGEALLARYATRIEHLSKEGADMSYGIFRAKRSTPHGTPNSVIRFLANIASRARKEGIRDGGRMSQEADNAGLCPDVRVPVLILSGGEDTVISAGMHAALINALPTAQQVVFPNAGHASYAEFPDLFNQRIKEFAMHTLR